MCSRERSTGRGSWELKLTGHETGLSSPVKYFYWPFLSVSFVCFFCLAFVMLLRLFIAALWLPAGKGRTLGFRLLCLIVFLSLSLVTSLVRRDT